jgi:hypothetical protein
MQEVKIQTWILDKEYDRIKKETNENAIKKQKEPKIQNNNNNNNKNKINK